MTDVRIDARIDVAIVGAGFAGLGAALQLSRRGRESFVVLERGEEVGGTWRDNTYPGVACDVPSHLYSYSFAPKPDWSRVFAPGAEIQEYLRACAREVADHVRLRTEVLRARWEEDHWVLATSTGTVRARVLVLAAGRLTEPRVPAGLDAFDGPVFHTARWDHSLDLAGARVGVVGTGASAVQVVPRLAAAAAHLTVFQRSAPYVVPRGDRAYSAAELAEFTADPRVPAAVREETFSDMERGLAARRLVSSALEPLRRRALDHLAAQVPDEALRAALTPDYEVGCKRVLLSDDFYPALGRDDVTLAPALAGYEGRSALAVDGSRHDLDVVVLATGFHATRQPYARRVVGRDGLTLDEAWAEGMVSHASTVVHGFPNLFVLDGPNASLGHNSALHVIESQLGYLLGALDHLGTHDRPLEVSRAAQRAYTADVDAMAARSVWLRGGCSSWYVDQRSGRLTLLWPDTAGEFRRRNGTFDPEPFLG
ncbi:flavin-containing monooxygenase [Kineococcus sp. GCM10028916]|uniref:flavin-containing monooxygenase n=1 Tax=Kineococcus sp. GCM10028916 TaxID=3273394 RepID=UPI0036371AF2